MKKLALFLAFSCVYLMANAQFVARMEVKDSIPGICDDKEVYVFFPGFKGQTEAECPVSKADILKRLNKEVTFLQDKPKYKGSGMLTMIINCKGEVIQCKMDTKTKNPDLDDQIVAVFNSLGEWNPGAFDGRVVDSLKFYSFKIKKGQIVFE